MKTKLSAFGLNYLLTNLQNKTRKNLFRVFWKNKALRKCANHNWQEIAKRRNLGLSFEEFFEKLKRNRFVEQIISSTQFSSLLPKEYSNPRSILKRTKTISILGSKEINLENNKIPWHQDIKIAPHKTDDSKKFYQDIVINTSSNQSFKDYSYDIKVPWELSRMQHLFYLGKTYKATQDEKYAKTFVLHVEDWINENPYLLGPNWVGPMEIAIRSINLIWAFHFFKNSKSIPLSFWGKFVCSLYDHAHYLEYNWEKYTPTNNHYLSDLLGYLYLCTFFQDIKYFKKAQIKTHKEILKEFDKQIQNDGTSYEGSTNYQKLVTEIFLHFKLLCEVNKRQLPESFQDQFNKMTSFLENCSDQNGNLAQIGDNDSGKILTGIKIPSHSTNSEILKHYPNFGISIIKTKKWHVTFRHPTFNKKQPSGHFHEDELSITLSINGQPILVDPGSYLYTANSKWRNFMRSKENHNSFFVLEEKNNINDQGLFELDRTTQQNAAQINNLNDEITITHHIKKHDGLIPHRQIKFNKNEKLLEIEDWWQTSNKTHSKEIKSHWSLIFHPDIFLEQHNAEWHIKHQNSTILKMKTALPFHVIKGWYSPEYGIIKPCAKLVATKTINLVNGEKHKTIFKPL